jgi:hypothetical protein
MRFRRAGARQRVDAWYIPSVTQRAGALPVSASRVQIVARYPRSHPFRRSLGNVRMRCPVGTALPERTGRRDGEASACGSGWFSVRGVQSGSAAAIGVPIAPACMVRTGAGSFPDHRIRVTRRGRVDAWLVCGCLVGSAGRRCFHGRRRRTYRPATCATGRSELLAPDGMSMTQGDNVVGGIDEAPHHPNMYR